MALTRATGTLLRCIDCDDLLPDHETLARDIKVLESNPSYGWTVSPCVDLHPDGRLEAGPYYLPPGPLPDRVLLDGAKRGELAVMGTTLTARTDLLRLVGGWPAIPAFEDAALLLFCEAVSHGWMQALPGELYRKHPGQQTATSAFHDTEEKIIRQKVAIDRAETLHSSGWRWPKEACVIAGTTMNVGIPART
ncbi:GltA [Streptomyces sp. NPDC048281]|uniref:GltA n=1 Tax=Streptomyces sp. NPDC048281 TaxID=3154715 RepID=UPI0034364CA5